MNLKFWTTAKPPTLRIQLRIGGKLMWDISEQELRATVRFNGGVVTESTRTAFANQLIEFTVTEVPSI